MTSAIRFCSSCGKELPHDNVASCPNCGIANCKEFSTSRPSTRVTSICPSAGTGMLIALIAGIFGLGKMLTPNNFRKNVLKFNLMCFAK